MHILVVCLKRFNFKLCIVEEKSAMAATIFTAKKCSEGAIRRSPLL